VWQRKYFLDETFCGKFILLMVAATECDDISNASEAPLQ
jgi:hypothetical protein